MRRGGGGPRSQGALVSGCDVKRLPGCSLEALSALGPACLGLGLLLGGHVGVDCGEPGTEAGVLAHTEKWPLDWKGEAEGWESRDPGPTLSLVHRAAMSSRPPALPGLRVLTLKMGLITHYLNYEVVRKIKCAYNQLIGWPVADWSLVASFACLEVGRGFIYQSASVVSPWWLQQASSNLFTWWLGFKSTVVEAARLLKRQLSSCAVFLPPCSL